MIASFLVALAHLSQPAAAPVQVGTWQVRERESSCTLDTSFRSGTVLRIEYYPQQDDYAVMLANPAWTDIEDGRRYRIDLRGNYRRRLPVQGRGVREGAAPAAMYIPIVPRMGSRHLAENAYFENIIQVDRQMEITREGRPWISLHLQDTSRALSALALCADRLTPQKRSPLSVRVGPKSP